MTTFDTSRGPELFTTVHGSRLYGLNHDDSDYDTYTVLADPDAKLIQSITDDDDRVTVGWRVFLDYAMEGSHQSAEALFSTKKVYTELGLASKPMFDAVRLGPGTVAAKYERTIRKFCFGDVKRRRHAVRLAFALAGIRACGKFNPTLTDAERYSCTYLALHQQDEELLRTLGVPESGGA